MSEAQKAAIIGGGVIGGGWTARFLLNGWDVAVYDPDPDAERKIGEVLANARRSLPSLYDFALPDEGSWTSSRISTMPSAAPGGSRKACRNGSTSSAPCTAISRPMPRRMRYWPPPPRLQAVGTRRGCCPSGADPGGASVQSVYLLPLVEVVPSPCTDGAIRDRAVELMRGVGMYPLLIRKEIDGHVNDRLQEALWREALWLVSDGIATTREIDDSIRFGCGLRWAQMGSFQTFWLAGGEGGMRHFMAQFGPALKWPWTKLMDVPELTDTLIDTIADQCDQQSGGMTPREMERVRDNNLVGMMRALKRTDWGAGASLNEHDRSLVPEGPAAPEPVEMFRRQVPQSWLDYNGHMNEAHYLEVFSQANDRIMALVGADQAYIDRGLSFFTVETHIRHLDELHAGEGIRVTTQVLQGSGKRLRVFHRLETDDGRLAATGEHLLIHVNLSLRKSCEPDEPVRSKLAAYEEAHRNLALPEGAGRSIG